MFGFLLDTCSFSYANLEHVLLDLDPAIYICHADIDAVFNSKSQLFLVVQKEQLALNLTLL